MSFEQRTPNLNPICKVDYAQNVARSWTSINVGFHCVRARQKQVVAARLMGGHRLPDRRPEHLVDEAYDSQNQRWAADVFHRLSVSRLWRTLAAVESEAESSNLQRVVGSRTRQMQRQGPCSNREKGQATYFLVLEPGQPRDHCLGRSQQKGCGKQTIAGDQTLQQ